MSAACQSDLTAISDLPAMSFPDGESVPEILINTSLLPSDVDGTEGIDATHDADPAVEMFNNEDPNFDFFKPTDQTVADYFRHNSRTEGFTPPPPGTQLSGEILFRAGYVAGLSTGQAAAFLLHEVLHTLGGIDAQIQKVLGLPTGNGTENISTKLYNDCFKGFKP